MSKELDEVKGKIKEIEGILHQVGHLFDCSSLAERERLRAELDDEKECHREVAAHARARRRDILRLKEAIVGLGGTIPPLESEGTLPNPVTGKTLRETIESEG